MKKITYLLLTTLLILNNIDLNGQDLFERLYTTTNTDVLSTSLHQAGTGFLMLGVQINEDGDNQSINLTSLDAKGTINWSQEYDYDIDDEVFISELGEVELLPDGTIMFSALLQQDSLNKLVTRVTSDGNVLWTRLTGQASDEFVNLGYRSRLVSAEDMGTIHITNNRNGDVDEPLTVNIGSDGELIWGQSWEVSDTSGNVLSSVIRDATFLVDSTILIAGNNRDEGHQLYLTKMDTLGNIIWSRSYTGDIGSGINQSALSVVEMADSTLLVLGSSAGGTTSGVLINVDQTGELIQGFQLQNQNAAFEMFPNNIVPLIDSTFAISMRMLNNTDGTILPQIVRMSLDSTFLYSTLGKESTDMNITQSGLIADSMLAVSFLTSTERLDGMTLIPSLTKLDPDGATGCDDIGFNLSLDSIDVSVDTLMWVGTEQLEMDSIDVLALSFDEFNPPLLTLQDTNFCPQDPVLFTFDGTVRGATSYLWDDGVTDSIRTVMETGMFILTVEVGIEECFVLCDTGFVNQSMFPTAMISMSTPNFCSDGEIILQVQASNPITSINWSTGEQTEFIVVTELTNYSVTIIDDCDNPATATVNLTDFTMEIDPVIDVSTANICVDNTLFLRASGDFLEEDLIWSMDGTDIAVGVATINVSEPGTYTAENVGQFCPGINSVEITEDDFLNLAVEISGDCSPTNDFWQLVATGTDIESFLWTTGETTSSIAVTEPGEFSVMVTDICGNEETETITVTEDDIDNCIILPPPPEVQDCLEFPNAVFPESNNDRNTTFGPEDMNCGNATIENYELSIYNRWGNRVFESNNIDTRWNGRRNNDGRDQPSTVYFWYATYVINDNTFENEGDVTIIR